MFTIFSYFRLISKTYWYYLQHLELIPIIKFSIIWPIIIINLIINNFFLSLDHIFFNFKNILIKTPFFIIGFPRSGTTFLHKSITNDKQFTTPCLWELIFAPSIIQKLVWKKIYTFININLANKEFSLIRRFTKRFDNIHEIKLSNPEEDYLIFTPYGACFLLIIIMPIDDIWKLINFDENFSTKYKTRLMKKYKLFIQRHLFVYGKSKIYLSKNPYFTSLLHTLYKTFPDCNIIGCYRNPQQSIPSLLSNMHEAYLLMSRKITSNNHIDKYILMYKNYYTIIFEQLKKTPVFYRVN